MSSDKLILETPQDHVNSTQNYNLKDCINMMLNKKNLNLNITKVISIIINDLGISLKGASTSMKYVLCESLGYYIRIWPGWKQYNSVCTNESTKAFYQEKLKEYLVFKLKYIMENENVFKTYDHSRKSKSQAVQTDLISCDKTNRFEAPYKLIITGQPHFLNNIGFIGIDENIIIREHTPRPWLPVGFEEFLNYPFVEVSVKLPNLEMSRSNVHEFARYIAESEDTVKCPNKKFIDFVRKKNCTSPVKVYSIDYINAYFDQFLQLAKSNVNGNKLTELEHIFKQFISDIKESNVHAFNLPFGENVNTMATNTAVCFNIGGKTYMRSKKISFEYGNKKAQSKEIHYSEILVPKMMYALTTFTAEEDLTTDTTSFVNLNQVNINCTQNIEERQKFNNIINYCITYNCLLCSSSSCGEHAYNKILQHYKLMHKGEYPVVCPTCRKEFSISYLAGKRWAHECEKTAEIRAASIKVLNSQSTNQRIQNVNGDANENNCIANVITNNKIVNGEDVINNQTDILISTLSTGSLVDISVCNAMPCASSIVNSMNYTPLATSVPVAFKSLNILSKNSKFTNVINGTRINKN